jgi:hypothetical protein
MDPAYETDLIGQQALHLTIETQNIYLDHQKLDLTRENRSPNPWDHDLNHQTLHIDHEGEL